MARPRSEDKRSAILSAATRVIASQGLAAATATVAQLGVSGDITPASHQIASHGFAGIRELLERSREHGTEALRPHLPDRATCTARFWQQS